MEKDSPSKPSVAELAGRFKGHIPPMPTSNDEARFRRRPPSSLKLPKDNNEESSKPLTSPNPPKVKMKNSALIEKLQANLALSPTALLPSPKSPEVKLQPAPLSPTTPLSPLSPQSPGLRSSQQSSEEEDPASFQSPPEGTPLPSINKTRARLSFKRRPPTRQHRRSVGEEAGSSGNTLSPCELSGPNENGYNDQVFDSPAEGAAIKKASPEEAEEKDKDCEMIEEGAIRNNPEDIADLEEQSAGEQGQNPEDLEEEQQPTEPCPAESEEKEEKSEEREEEKPEEATEEGNEGM